MRGKIALEEHLATPEFEAIWDVKGEAARNGEHYMAEVRQRLLDVDQRLRDMDRFGIETVILSLTSPGVQGLPHAARATELARRTNAQVTRNYVRAYHGRFRAFATVALQDPSAAADEAERAVKELGMLGVLVNGYTNVGDPHTAQYLDETAVWEFWDRVAQLDVPVYLHPREPLASQQGIYEGYPTLVGSAWGFAHDPATRAVRLMLSGLFDHYPNLLVILGHLGEGLPQLLPRSENRLAKQRYGSGAPNAKRPVGEYFRRNFYLTTSGHFHTTSLVNAIAEIGVERLTFAVDYPYEYTEEAARWLDATSISDQDRQAIGRDNACRLFRLN